MSVSVDAAGVEGARHRKHKRGQPKGRQVDPTALNAVQDVLGDMPRRRDLLLESVHRLNDQSASGAAATA
jgi:formate dehydrogenase